VGEPRNDGRESRPKEPLTIARLEAWAERLRGAERPLRTDDASMAAKAPVVAEGTGADEALIAQEAPVVPNPPVRSIRPEDLVPIGRKPPEPPTAPEPPVAERPLVRPRLEVVAGSSGFRVGGVPSSPGVRFILLCLAAFFLSAGAVHSYTRWKQTRVIVVPATTTPGSVIT
jgi:hypothetical protein